MDAALGQIRALDPRVRIGAGAVAVLLVIGGIAAISLGNSTAATKATPTPPIASPTAEPLATAPRPRATPFGTPAPRPKTFVGVSASIRVSPPPSAKPSPSPEPGLWRLQGYIVDESGNPIENVCVVIGPVSCQPFSPKTDERGHYFVDIAAAGTPTVLLEYDFFFEIPGRETVWLRMNPTGPTFFNAVLRRT